jgi:hypothetical protein
MKIRFTFFIIFLFITSIKGAIQCMAQGEIDIVDPYEMKVSRSKKADTFYFTEKSSPVSKAKFDTLRSYDVYLEERPTPFGTAYMCNGKEVTKQKFAEYKLLWNASGACKPCLLYTYDDKDELKYAAYQYEDCLCGSYVEYYPDGARKLEGQFKENKTGDWNNMKARDLCNVREGKWTYYFQTGVTEKTEVYANGKLVSVTNPEEKASAEKKSEGTAEESTQKKGLLQRMKDKNKSNDN